MNKHGFATVAIIAILTAIGLLGFSYIAVQDINASKVASSENVGGTINSLPEWVASTTPNAIFPRVTGKDVGLWIKGSTQCLEVDANGVITGAGAACGTGSGGGAAWEKVGDNLRPTSTLPVLAPNGLSASSTINLAASNLYGDMSILTGGTNTYTIAGGSTFVISAPAGRNMFIGGTTGDYLSLNRAASNPVFHPSADSDWELGRNDRYWLNTYTDNLYLNSTAFFSGSTAGLASLMGNLRVGGNTTTTGSMNIGSLTAASCDVKSDTNGLLYCGTDATGGSGTGIYDTDADTYVETEETSDEDTIHFSVGGREFLNVDLTTTQGQLNWVGDTLTNSGATPNQVYLGSDASGSSAETDIVFSWDGTNATYAYDTNYGFGGISLRQIAPKAGGGVLELDGTIFRPLSDDATDIGASGNRFKDLWLSGTASSTIQYADTYKNLPKYVEFVLLPKTASTTPDTTLQGDFRLPFSGTITEVGAYVDTAGTGSTASTTIDINKNGTTILSTKITLDSTEKTSATATVQPVISVSSYSAGDILTFDIDDVADTLEALGLKVWVKVKQNDE